MAAGLDGFFDYAASEERASCFGADDHGRTGTQDGVKQRIENEGVETVDWGDVTKVRGV